MRFLTNSRLAIVNILALTPLLASAATIINGGFEDPVTGTFTKGNVINGWSIISGSGGGVWNINSSPNGYWNVPAPEGNQVGWLAADGLGPASVQQTLTETIAAGFTYSLSGKVGHPIGFGASQTPDTVYTVDILAGATVLATFSGTGPEGSFTDFAVNWTQNGHLGELLSIRLSSSDTQTAFDALSFTGKSGSTSVPDAGSVAWALPLICLVHFGLRATSRLCHHAWQMKS